MQVAPVHLHLARHAGLRRQLQDEGLDALLITSLSNVAYLSGLFASAAAIVITRDRFTIITDGRYRGVANGIVEALAGVDLVVTPASVPFDQALAETLCSIAHGRAGFESMHFTVKRFRELESRLAQIAPGISLEGTEGLVERFNKKYGAQTVEQRKTAAKAAKESKKATAKRPS